MESAGWMNTFCSSGFAWFSPNVVKSCRVLVWIPGEDSSSFLCVSVLSLLVSPAGAELCSQHAFIVPWLTAPVLTGTFSVTADDGSAGDDAFVCDSAFCDSAGPLCFLSSHQGLIRGWYDRLHGLDHVVLSVIRDDSEDGFNNVSLFHDSWTYCVLISLHTRQ